MNINSPALQHVHFAALEVGRVVERGFRVYTDRIEVRLTDVKETLTRRDSDL